MAVLLLLFVRVAVVVMRIMRQHVYDFLSVDGMTI